VSDIKIVLVDGNVEAMDIKGKLESLGYEVPCVVSTGEEAIKKVLDIKPDLVLMDIDLNGDMDCIEVASKIKEINVPLIFQTKELDDSKAKKVMGIRPYGVLIKPYEEIELQSTLEMAFYKIKAENELRWNENRLKTGMDMADMVYWEYNTEKDLFTFDDQFFALYGTSADEMGGNTMSAQEYVERFVDPSAYEFMENELKKTFEADDPNFSSTGHHWMKRADGEKRYIVVRFKILYDKNGRKIGTMGVNQDITEEKMAKDALRESEEKYRTLIESAKDPISLYNEEGIFLMANEAGALSMGKRPAELVGHSLREFFPPEIAEKQIELIRKVFSTEDGLEMEMPVPQGKQNLWFSTSLQPVYGHDNKVRTVQVISRNITDIKEAQIELQQALDEKEMLIKEIHHRVKNNLMIISSLLNLQSRYIEDKDARDVFRESQNRAKSMAMIHERLYQSTDLKNIDFGDYIQKLTTDLYRSMVSDPGRIKLDIDVEDVKIDINTVVPLGLIVNELVTNSMKHAFPRNESGFIKVELYKGENHKIILRVRDNGVGFPEDIDYKKTSSLGLQLVNSLTKQIGGEVELGEGPGTVFTIIFKEQIANG